MVGSATFEVLLGAQWLTTDAWLLLPGARISHCFCSKETVFIEGSGCGSDRHLWLEQSGRTFQDYHGRAGEMQGRGDGTSKVDQKWWNTSGTSIEPLEAVTLRLFHCRTSSELCQDLHVTKNETRKARIAPFLFELDPLTSWNFEAFPDEMFFCLVSGWSSIPHAGQPVTLALRSTSWRKYVVLQVLQVTLVLYTSPKKQWMDLETAWSLAAVFPLINLMFLIWLLITGDISSSDPEVCGAVVWGHRLAIVLRGGVILLRNDTREFSLNDIVPDGPHLSKLNHG